MHGIIALATLLIGFPSTFFQNNTSESLSFQIQQTKATNGNQTQLDSTTNPYKSADVFLQKGLECKKENKVQQAKEQFHLYLAAAKKLRSEPAITRAYFQLGSLYFSQEDYDRSLEYFRFAADYMELLGDSCGLAKIDNNIGAVYYQKGELLQAEAYFESSLKLSEYCQDFDNIAKSYLNLADLNVKEQNWEKAHQYYAKALHYSRDMQFTASVRYSRGLALVKQGRLQEGHDELAKAIELNQDNQGVESISKQQDLLKTLKELISDIKTLENEKGE